MMSSEKAQSLIDRAKPFYDEDLAYHAWPHAEQVMGDTVRIIDAMEEQGSPIDTDSMRIFAAWHDAGHEDPVADTFESKEHYSVWLMRREIGSELSDETMAMGERAILATRFGVERTVPEEIILHYADVANMGYSYQEFLEYTTRLWREYGSPDWVKFVAQAQRVIRQCAEEAERELPRIGLAIDIPRSFPMMARANAERLQQERAPR